MINSNPRPNNWEPIDFTIYFTFIRWWLLALLVVEIVFRLAVLRLTGGLLVEQQELIAWLWRLGLIGVMTWRVLRAFGYSPAIGAIAGGLTGFVAGLGISLYRLADGLKIWKLFNIVTESTMTALVGALLAVAIMYLLTLKSK